MRPTVPSAVAAAGPIPASVASPDMPARWAYGATDEDDRAAARDGLRKVRELWQMRRPLPVEPALAAGDPAIATRAFVPGRDDGAWLRVNNRAFAGHPDQSGWTTETLAGRMAEDWFDPAGFLLHESPDTGEVDGFCWTKVHPATATDPAMGEIYVIGADPSTHGHGLGRALVLAGLAHLHDVRGMTTGMLYVEHDNAPAVRLYEKLGFTVHDVDRMYDSPS